MCVSRTFSGCWRRARPRKWRLVAFSGRENADDALITAPAPPDTIAHAGGVARGKVGAVTEMRPTPRLRELRERAGLTPGVLARRAGVSPEVYRRAEKGAPVFPDTIRTVAEALGVKAEDLIEDSAPGS